MKTGKQWSLFISLLLIILFIVPFVYVTKYTVYVSDDLCRINELSFSEYLDTLEFWYLHQNGRIVNAVLTSIPVGNLWVYRSLLVACFVLLGAGLFKFLLQLIEHFRLSISKYKVLRLSVIWYIVIIGLLPSVYEFFYWYAAVTVYLLAFIAFLFFLISALRLYEQKPVRSYWMLFLIIFIVGSNELLVGIVNFLLLFLLLFDFIKRRKIGLNLLVYNMVSWICTLILVMSPGMTTRRAQFDYGGNLYGSVKVAIIYGAKYIFLYFTEFPFVIFYLLFFVIIFRNLKQVERLKALPPLYLAVISYLCIISLFFINFYAIGLLSHKGRIANIVRLVMQVFFLLNILNLAIYLKQKKYISWLENKYIPVVLALSLFLTLFFTNKNYTDLREDFVDGSFERMKKEQAQRDTILQNTVLNKITLKKIEGTRILESGDKVMHLEWVESCYRNYINEKYDKNLREIRITE